MKEEPKKEKEVQNVLAISFLDEFNSLLKNNGSKLIAIDFYATWCGPCKAIGPKFKEMAESGSYPNTVFVKIDVDQAKDITSLC